MTSVAPRGVGPRLRLRLYIAGAAPNSVRALANLRHLCEDLLPGRYDLEVIDVLENPVRGLADSVFVTPTLVKLSRPEVRIVGSLSDREALIEALDLHRFIDESCETQ